MPRVRCLLEIREAAKIGKPIVLLELQDKGFSFDDALYMLDDLERELPLRNPDALDELRAHLGRDESLLDLQQTVKRALEGAMAEHSGRVPRLNIQGTAHQLEAQLMDLVEGLAAVTGRNLQWTHSLSRVTLQSNSHLIGRSMSHESHVSSAKSNVSRSNLVARAMRRVALLREPSAEEKAKPWVVVHHMSADADARRLAEGIERTIGKCCVTSPPTQMDAIAQSLALIDTCEGMVLLQTSGVLDE